MVDYKDQVFQWDITYRRQFLSHPPSCSRHNCGVHVAAVSTRSNSEDNANNWWHPTPLLVIGGRDHTPSSAGQWTDALGWGETRRPRGKTPRPYAINDKMRTDESDRTPGLPWIPSSSIPPLNPDLQGRLCPRAIPLTPRRSMSRRAQTQRKMAHKLRKTGTSRRPHPHPVSISTLPFEILAYIFIVIRNTATSQSHWVRLAWVCGYWRAVALQTHLLWTNLSFSHLRDLDFVAILLRRADGLDLELTVDTTTSDIPMAIAPFLDHLHQLRSLSLTFLHDQTQAVQDTLNISLPRLVTLAVRAVYPAGTEDDAEGGVAQLFIDPTAIPALRNLHITSLRIDAPQSVFSGLVGLELSRIQGERFSPLIDWVIDILEACGPTLQHLTIRSVEYWGTIWVGTQHLPRSLLPFPRLRTLKMRGTAPGYSSSLARFRLPDTTSFDLSLLWTYVDDRWAAFTDVLFPYRRADRDAALPILLRTRRLCVQAGKSFYLTGRAENTEEPLWTATANLKDLPRQGSIDMFPNMIVDLSSLLQRDSVVEYECHFAPYFPTYEPWPRIIGAFRDIRKFTFGGTRTVKEALEELVGCRAGLPNLQEMTLCIPEVADSTVKALVECKKLKLRRGEAVIPGVVTFRLPQRLAQCRATRATIEKLRIRLVRFIRLEVCYLDCDFCQQLPKRVPPRRSLRAQGEEVDNTPAHSTLSVDGLD